METFSGMLTIAGWFLIRFAVPFMVTIAICWVLHKLDKRWLKDSEGKQATVHMRNLTTIMNCWLYHDCPKKQRSQCPAYQNPDIPCWQQFRKDDGYLQNRCVGCAVFRSAPAPSYGD